ncbi:hypothetical protein [Vulcanisaeta sp. JCM 16161]|uniref:hypothetical protein n=1 Tax=Vulcanisaeta sp. JCM 16161 TaxID=1295372 RepID=UPI0006D036BC|nr:hypothetical protein [Vulcanisaeta sp. JCM 16161]
MLGLGSDYEFRLVLTPVMNISVVGFPPTGPGNFNLVIRVLNSVDNTPISGAEVGIQYFAIDQAGNDLACQYGLVTPCTPAPSNAQLPPASTFTILSTKPLIIEGSEVGYTNRSGYVVFTLPLSYDGDNSYFIIIRASLAGLGDYYYFQYPTQSTPLLMVGVLPMGTTYNSIVFTDPHLFTDCLINSGLVANPSATSLGLRVIAVYRSLYGYVFEGLNFTLNPGRGSHSYPIPCSSLAASNASDYSACYWNLPSEPMLLIVNVVRNSQGQAGAVPLAQSIIVPYGLYPNYLMNNGPIVFGESIRDAPVGTATALVYIGDSTYYATLYLYYGGNAFEPMGQQ